MGQKTQRYKRSMSGSVGAGMKSLFGGGRRYYVLEHKMSSKYHKAGEEQKIIVDQVELGRSPNCAVRIDGVGPIFDVVSRRHAAIVKDGDNWKLVHLSKVNPTYLNGEEMRSPEWYLQNGDEIQLSKHGPKLGFKIPQGDNSLVKSIGLSARLSLFRQQALRPYRQAIAALSCVLVLMACTSAYFLNKQHGEIIALNNTIAVQDSSIVKMRVDYENQRVQDSITNIQKSHDDSIRHAREIRKKDQETRRLIEEAERRWREEHPVTPPIEGLAALLQQQNVYKDVFFLMTKKVVIIRNGVENVIDSLGWTGTGFLLCDGRFVTARHCIEGWWYQDFSAQTSAASAAREAATKGLKIKAYLIAVSSISNTQFQFTSDDFRIDRSKDHIVQIGTDESGNPIKWRFTFPLDSSWDKTMWATDWAYTIQTDGKKGDLLIDSQLSRNLLPMQTLVALGFPQAIGVGDGSNTAVEPIPSELKTSRNGLAANGCIMHSRGTDHGNSGGPILAIKEGKLVVIGIVSRGDYRTTEHNWAVPICNIN